MNKDGTVTINSWYEGQQSHPIAGFGLLKNVEVFENKGIVKIKTRSVLRSSISPTQLPIAEVTDVDGSIYTATGHSGQGIVYKNGVAITSALSNMRDIKIYNDYLFIRHSDSMSMYGPLSSGSAQYFAGYTGFDTSYSGQILVAQDSFIYVTNGNKIAKIEVTASGTPAVQPTLSITFDALDLRDGQYATCIEELGTNIIIGTQGGGSYEGRGDTREARLYPWNRQAGTLGNPGLADLPVIFNENGINAIKQFANRLYISAGTQGNIYVSDGTNYSKVATLPSTADGVNSPTTVFINAIDISARGTLLIGLSGDQNTKNRPGVYEIDISGNNAVVYRSITSTAGVTSNIGFIDSVGYNTLNVGWSDGTTYGVDTTDSYLYPSYGAVIESPLYRVGRSKSKKTFQHIEWTLADPLVSGQNIRISYRKNSTGVWTVINTWGYSTLGGVTSFEDVAAIHDAEYVQLKIELNQDIATVYGSNIKLISVNLW